MREQAQECAEYFRSNPGYHRILAALRQKYQSFGRPAGIVCLSVRGGPNDIWPLLFAASAVPVGAV